MHYHQLALTIANKQLTYCLQQCSRQIHFVLLLKTKALIVPWLGCVLCIVDSTNDRRPRERYGPTRGAGYGIPEGHHGDYGGTAAVWERQCVGGNGWEDEFSRH